MSSERVQPKFAAILTKHGADGLTKTIKAGGRLIVSDDTQIAANHDGDSDLTTSIAGQLYGQRRIRWE